MEIMTGYIVLIPNVMTTGVGEDTLKRRDERKSDLSTMDADLDIERKSISRSMTDTVI